MTIIEALVRLRNDLKLWVANNLRTKLDKNLGAEESGKVLAVDENGDIITVKNDSIVVDDELSLVSTNPVQNKVIAEKFDTLVGDTPVSNQIGNAISQITHPVNSVNGKTGTVVLTASDVSALPNTTVIPSIDGLATEEFVTNKIAEASLSGGEVDLSGFATVSYVDEKATSIKVNATLPAGRLYGDVNGDGVVNTDDVSILDKHLTNGGTLTGVSLLAADMDRDGEATDRDLTMLEDYCVEALENYTDADCTNNWKWDSAKQCFYHNLAINGVTSQGSAIIIMNTSMSGFSAECGSNLIRIYSEKVPVVNIDCSIIYSSTGSATTILHNGVPDVITESDVVDVAAPNKLLRLNDRGKLPADITGSAASATTAVTATNVDWSGVQNVPTELTSLFANNMTILTLNNQYGDTLPSAGNPGRLFMKKLSG